MKRKESYRDSRAFALTGIFLLGAILTTAGCRAPTSPEYVPPKVQGPRDAMRLDPIHVKATQDEGDKEVIVEAYDAKKLFKDAAAHLRAGECAEAVDLYKTLVAEFETSELAPLSLYNSGLCNEQLELFESATVDYLTLIDTYPDSPDVTHALFRLAGSYEELELWDKASATFAVILEEREDVDGLERVEALARRGSALLNDRRYDEADLALKEAVAIFRAERDIPPGSSTFYHGMARFKQGEIIAVRMREVALPSDETILEPALENKCQLLLDAQREYTQAIKVGHPHWAAAAAYRIGHLYRDLWDDMTNAPPPEDLTEEEKAIYAEVLRDRIQNLLKKAVKQWERTLKMARRLNLDNEWVDKTTAELEEIRETLALEDTAEISD